VWLHVKTCLHNILGMHNNAGMKKDAGLPLDLETVLNEILNHRPKDSGSSGWGIGQGVETRYKGYLRVRGGSRINGRVGIGEVGSPDPVSVAGHPEV